jgi:DNA-binding transcriptional MocR family regulator
VALAAKHEFALVEDTVLDALSYDADPGPPLWSLAPERVMAAGSLSKTAWGGLRIGWLRAPRQVVLRLARLKGSLNLGVGAFDQLAALELLTRPEEEVAGRRRAQAFERMRTMAEALTREIPEWEVEPPHGGWSLWIALPSGSASAFVQAALRHGVAVSPGGGCGLNDEFPERIRICFGPEPDLLEDAARRLRGCWRAFDPQAPAVPAFV